MKRFCGGYGVFVVVLCNNIIIPGKCYSDTCTRQHKLSAWRTRVAATCSIIWIHKRHTPRFRLGQIVGTRLGIAAQWRTALLQCEVINFFTTKSESPAPLLVIRSRHAVLNFTMVCPRFVTMKLECTSLIFKFWPFHKTWQFKCVNKMSFVSGLNVKSDT